MFGRVVVKSLGPFSSRRYFVARLPHRQEGQINQQCTYTNHGMFLLIVSESWDKWTGESLSCLPTPFRERITHCKPPRIMDIGTTRPPRERRHLHHVSSESLRRQLRKPLYAKSFEEYLGVPLKNFPQMTTMLEETTVEHTALFFTQLSCLVWA